MEILTTNLQISNSVAVPLWVLLLIMLWIIPWKGYALWNAARHSHRNWFIILLMVNSLALLEIIYIFFINKKKKK